jgi:hypothetical protein
MEIGNFKEILEILIGFCCCNFLVLEEIGWIEID